MSILSSRITAVALGAVLLVGVGATGATAAKLITGSQIKDGTITAADVANNSLRGTDIADSSLTGKDIYDGTVGLYDLNKATQNYLRPQSGTKGVWAVRASGDDTIEHIGGSINANNTDLNTKMTLPAGRWLVHVDGTFESATAAADPAVDVYPQLSLWLDRNGDDEFRWQEDEGSISPNALMPTAKNRHISTSGSTIITLDEPTKVGLLAFGYASNEGTARSGEIKVTSAVLTATPLR